MVRALETWNFSDQFAEFTFRVIWCLTSKSTVPSSSGLPLMILMTSTWIDTHSHSLYRFTVILLMVQVAFDAGPAAKPFAWARGAAPMVTRSWPASDWSATADGAAAVPSSPIATAPVVSKARNFKLYPLC